jgi:membrane protein YqaA with SNARE-associated domain
MADAADGGQRHLDRRAGAWTALAAFWSFAEATIFFVVPDVIVSAIALRFGWRNGLAAACIAAFAAALGGLAVHLATGVGNVDPFPFYDALPAISPEMIDRVRNAMGSNDWPLAMLQGSFSGMPYKLYAAAAASSTATLPFVLWSVPVRLVRFALVAVAAALIGGPLQRRLGPRPAMAALLAFWVLFYVVYWMRMPG